MKSSMWGECVNIYLLVAGREGNVEKVGLRTHSHSFMPAFHLAFLVVMQAEQSSEALKRAGPAL